MRFALVVALVGILPACSAALEDPTGISGSSSDAGGGSNVDAGTDDAASISSDATSDAAACTVARSVYLNFEGQTLTLATTSDATANQASWLNKPTGTAPKFRADNPNRAAVITTITNGITAALAGIPVEVVTTRPATGPYVMVVFGGTAAQIGSRFGRAVQKLDCGNLVQSDVAWVGEFGNQVVINDALGAIGFGLGLTGTTTPTDCMCGWDNNCTASQAATCTLSTSIARDPTANQTCPNVTSQDEVAAFTQGFCP